ncbi:CDP-alcohol phosphatidyltransferase family protein [Oxalobacteraceae bacterium]|nr:CDP-alcohol phosphatidyltransferase family protein [Oxalobacteraceae bacterium]
MSFSIYQLKPKFQQLLRPVLAGLARRGVTPNQVTLLAMLLSLLYGLALVLAPQRVILWAGLPLFMLLRMALNAIDGMLANYSGLKTPLGALLNEMGDQISDAALILPFALLPALQAPLVVLAAVMALLAEFAGVAALLAGAKRRFDGPMGKSDRAFAFGLLALLVAGGAAPAWMNGLLHLVLALLAFTIVNRLRQALRNPCAPPIL